MFNANLEGKIVLGRVEEGSENEHLDISTYINHPYHLHFERLFSLLAKLSDFHFPVQNTP